MNDKPKQLSHSQEPGSVAKKNKHHNTMAVKRTADGTIDKRTKEGKAVAQRMEKARAAKENKSVLSKIEKLLK